MFWGFEDDHLGTNTVKLNGLNKIGETCVFIIEVTSLGDEFILMELSGIDSLFLSKSDS